MESTISITLSIALAVVNLCLCEEPVTVTSRNKLTIRGTRLTVPDIKGTRKINQFLGIQYARVPERFSKSVLVNEGNINATKFGPVCYQNPGLLKKMLKINMIPEMSENCLYLNVWSPDLSPTAKLPVLLFIHGGSFILGFSDMYRGDILTSWHDVVYVSINYRLSALGFLSSGDSVLPGNLGLWDQQQALTWVKNHIASFGGDPNRVTIAGHGTGGACVTYHIVSPQSRGLFHRAIIQSGFGFTKTIKQSRDQMEQVSRILGWASEDPRSIVNSLKSTPPETLVNTRYMYTTTIDGEFLPDSPLTLYNTGDFSKVDIITGFTKNDAYTLLPFIARRVNITMNSNITKKEVMTLLGSMLGGGLDTEVYKEYFGDRSGTSSVDLVRGLEVMFRDFLFAVPAFERAALHSNTVSVESRGQCKAFVYEYSHRSQLQPPHPSHSRPAWVDADHGDDLHLVTGDAYRASFSNTYTDQERKLSRVVMKYWVNFATTGDPNGKHVTFWPKYECKTQKYLDLDVYPRISAMFHPQRMQIWTERAPKHRIGDPYLARNYPCTASISNYSYQIIFIQLISTLYIY